MANLGQTDEALKLLNDDYSKNATLLKAEIFWNARQWGDAADAIKYLIEKPTPGKPLSQEQINYILDWATTLKKPDGKPFWFGCATNLCLILPKLNIIVHLTS